MQRLPGDQSSANHTKPTVEDFILAYVAVVTTGVECTVLVREAAEDVPREQAAVVVAESGEVLDGSGTLLVPVPMRLYMEDAHRA